MLTPTQEDYLEAIYNISRVRGDVRVTELAVLLGCRLPTVTRTLKKMVELGLLVHESRKAIRLSRQGRLTAEQLAGRHLDLGRFLTQVLGLSPGHADRDACRLEHGLSPLAAERLRGWLSHLDSLTPAVRELALQFPGRDVDTLHEFHALSECKPDGWRG